MDLQTDELQVFDETDGTEIEDDEVLLSYDKGSVFLMGKKWLSRIKTKSEANSESNVEVKINLAPGDISRDTEFESGAGIMSDFEGNGDFPVDNFTGHTGLESEAKSISDCEAEGDLSVSNILGDSELGSEAGNMSDFNGKEDWDFGTTLQAGNMGTMKRMKDASCQKPKIVQNSKEKKSGM